MKRKASNREADRKCFTTDEILQVQICSLHNVTTTDPMTYIQKPHNTFQEKMLGCVDFIFLFLSPVNVSPFCFPE